MLKLWNAGRHEFSLHGRVVKGAGHLSHVEAMEAGGHEFSLHGRVVKGAGHLSHVEAMEMEVVSSASMAEWLRARDTLAMLKLWSAGRYEFSLHGRVVTGEGHLSHVEAMECGTL